MIKLYVDEGFIESENLDTAVQQDAEDEEVVTPVKTHEEILAVIQEIKGFEERFGEFEIVDVQVSDELIEIELPELTKTEELGAEEELKKSDLSKKFKKYKIFRVKVRQKSDEELHKKPLKSATFKIRFDETGQLVNMDLRKTVPKKPSKLKAKPDGKFSKLKHSLKRKGKKGESGDSERKEKKSKGGKLKGGFGKISKLKGVIPSKGKKKEKKSKKKE